MPFTSVNAHNLWWLLGAWRNADVPWLGPITATQFSFVLFGCFYAAMLWKAHQLHRRSREDYSRNKILLLAAALGFSFFILSTHMHENHLFTVIPLLAPCFFSPAPGGSFSSRSLAVLLNLSLHDLALNRHWPFPIGGESGFENHHFRRPFYVTELTAIWLSTFFNWGSMRCLSWGCSAVERRVCRPRWKRAPSHPQDLPHPSSSAPVRRAPTNRRNRPNCSRASTRRNRKSRKSLSMKSNGRDPSACLNGPRSTTMSPGGRSSKSLTTVSKKRRSAGDWASGLR